MDESGEADVGSSVLGLLAEIDAASLRKPRSPLARLEASQKDI